jgi:ribonuclease P protein component
LNTPCPSPKSGSLGFPKSARILTRSEFLAVQGSRQRVVARFAVFLIQPNDLDHFRVGFTVSKKHGGAVERNRIRRRLKEAVRLNLPLLTSHPVDAVVLPRQGAGSAAFADLLADVALLVRRLGERAA